MVMWSYVVLTWVVACMYIWPTRLSLVIHSVVWDSEISYHRGSAGIVAYCMFVFMSSGGCIL